MRKLRRARIYRWFRRTFLLGPLFPPIYPDRDLLLRAWRMQSYQRYLAWSRRAEIMMPPVMDAINAGVRLWEALQAIKAAWASEGAGGHHA